MVDGGGGGSATLVDLVGPERLSEGVRGVVMDKVRGNMPRDQLVGETASLTSELKVANPPNNGRLEMASKRA